MPWHSTAGSAGRQPRSEGVEPQWSALPPPVPARARVCLGPKARGRGRPPARKPRLAAKGLALPAEATDAAAKGCATARRAGGLDAAGMASFDDNTSVERRRGNAPRECRELRRPRAGGAGGGPRGRLRRARLLLAQAEVWEATPRCLGLVACRLPHEPCALIPLCVLCGCGPFSGGWRADRRCQVFGGARAQGRPGLAQARARSAHPARLLLPPHDAVAEVPR